jgi:hypothetical protein
LSTEGTDKSCAQAAVTRGSEGEKVKKPPLLEAVARERLLKTVQAGKGLAGALVNCRVWRSAVVL